MNPAETFCFQLYAKYPGRVPLAVGIRPPMGKVYPFVFESPEGVPAGLVGCTWINSAPSDLVQLYHVSTFRPGNGAGSVIMRELCALADNLQVRIYTVPDLIGVGLPEWELPDGGEDALRVWYGGFGFVPTGMGMTRGPA